MPPGAIKPEHIRRYMDKRGIKSRTQANREKAFMSRVYRWAYERGFVKGTLQRVSASIKKLAEIAT